MTVTIWNIVFIPQMNTAQVILPTALKQNWYVYRQTVSLMQCERSFLPLLEKAQSLGHGFDAVVAGKSVSATLIIENANPKKDIQGKWSC